MCQCNNPQRLYTICWNTDWHLTAVCGAEGWTLALKATDANASDWYYGAQVQVEGYDWPYWTSGQLLNDDVASGSAQSSGAIVVLLIIAA